MSVEQIKKYGVDDFSNLTRDELVAYVEYLEHNLNIAKKTLEFIVIEKLKEEELIVLVEKSLEYLSLRNWKK